LKRSTVSIFETITKYVFPQQGAVEEEGGGVKGGDEEVKLKIQDSINLCQCYAR